MSLTWIYNLIEMSHKKLDTFEEALVKASAALDLIGTGYFKEKDLIQEGPRTYEKSTRTSKRNHKCVIGEYCSEHKFHHGGEAKELRQRLEELIEGHDYHINVNLLQRLISDCDAIDSLAFLEILQSNARASAFKEAAEAAAKAPKGCLEPEALINMAKAELGK